MTNSDFKFKEGDLVKVKSEESRPNKHFSTDPYVFDFLKSQSCLEIHQRYKHLTHDNIYCFKVAPPIHGYTFHWLPESWLEKLYLNIEDD